MPARFVNLNRQTPMIPPCDLREWIPADHAVHFILDAVEQIPAGNRSPCPYPLLQVSGYAVGRRTWPRPKVEIQVSGSCFRVATAL